MIKSIIFDLDNTLLDFMKMKSVSIKAAVNAMIDVGMEINRQEAIDEIFISGWSNYFSQYSKKNYLRLFLSSVCDTKVMESDKFLNNVRSCKSMLQVCAC